MKIDLEQLAYLFNVADNVVLTFDGEDYDIRYHSLDPDTGLTMEFEGVDGNDLLFLGNANEIELAATGNTVVLTHKDEIYQMQLYKKSTLDIEALLK
jgi:Ca2+-binding RTX toxin-like protein